MPQDDLIGFKLQHLESQLDQFATKNDLAAVEARIVQEIKHSKALLKYGAIALVLVLGGSGVINSDMISLLMAAG
jgi:hypothetical protein